MRISKPFTFADICPTIAYSFEFLAEQNFDGRPKILIIKFIGKYRDGSEGDPDAAFINGIINTAIAVWNPHSVLLDLSELEYTWGDKLEIVFEPRGNKQLVTVVGSKCRAALSTLLNGSSANQDIVDNKNFFEERFEAIAELQHRLADTPTSAGTAQPAAPQQ